MLNAAEARQLTTLLFAVGQLLKKVDAIADRVAAYEEGLALRRTEEEIRQTVYQEAVNHKLWDFLDKNALWVRETEQAGQIKNVEL